MNSEYIELTLDLIKHSKSTEALLVNDGTMKYGAWIPVSTINGTYELGRGKVIEIKRWKAAEAGLI